MTATGTVLSVGDLRLLLPDFERSLKAANKSPKTIGIYTSAARLMIEFFLTAGMPTEAANVTRDHVETFVVDQVERRSPATANQRYRSLQSFWKFLLEEGEVTRSPMERMKPPKVPEQIVPVIPDDDLRRLLAACEGKACRCCHEHRRVAQSERQRARGGPLTGDDQVDRVHGGSKATTTAAPCRNLAGTKSGR